MSLKNCLKKAGKALPEQDRQAIDQLIADGLSESEAVQQHLDAVMAELEDIAGQAGGEVLFQGDVDLKQQVQDLAEQLESELGLESLFLSIKRSGDLSVDNIVVPKSDQKQGSGTKAMESIVEFADQNGLRVVLSPALADDRKGTTSRSRLVKFYKRFGFVENKGSNKDFAISEGMYREPSNVLYQSAYHGTPHTFDKFSLEAMGTGEGAQAYGWGLYFAGKREIAEYYKDSISSARFKTSNGVWNLHDIVSLYEKDSPEWLALQLLRVHKGDWNQVKKVVKQRFTRQETVDAIEALSKEVKPVDGNLYQVDIPEDSELLDWDKPLREQNQEIINKLKTIEVDAPESLLDQYAASSYLEIIEAHTEPDTRKQELADRYVSGAVEMGANETEIRKAVNEIVFGDEFNSEAWQVINNNPEPFDPNEFHDLSQEMESDTDTSGEDFYNELKRITGSDESASKLLDSVGIPGLRFLDATSRSDDSDQTHNYVIWDEDRVTVEAVNDEMRQAEILAQEGKTRPRGYFEPDANRITITPRADLSTFLHETSHWYLNVLRDLSTEHQEIARDVDIITDWARSQGAQNDRDIHEMFASGMETYFMEGKAPTPELQPVYSRFKGWLTLVYKQLQNVFTRNSLEGVQLSDEVRQVMDRTMATQEEIEAARAEMGYGPFKFERAGMDPATAARIGELHDEAMAVEESRLQAEVMKDYARERKDWWKKEHKERTAEVLDEIAQQTEYQARDFLSGDVIPDGVDPAKLDYTYVRDVYGKSVVSRLNKMTGSGGTHPDIIAPMFGFSTGDELIKALLGTMNKTERKKFAETEATQRMRQTHGDILNDGSLPDKALEVVHSDKRADILLAELRFFNKTSGKRPTARAVFKARAERSIAETPIDKLRPDLYRRNEIKAHNAATKAAATGDYETAAFEQARAVQQFYLYREAVNTREQAAKHQRRLNQIKKAKYSRTKYHPDYIQQVKVLVAAYDLRKSPKDSNELLSRVNNFIQAQAESNPDLIAGDLLADITSWKSLTIDELSAVRDAAENILHQGKALSEENQEVWRLMVDDVETSIRENTKKPKIESDSKSLIASAKRGKEQFAAIHRKLESLLQEADGWKDDGILQRLIFRNLWNAQMNEMDRRKAEHEELNALFEGYNYLFNGFKENLKDLESTQKYVDLHTMRLGTPETGYRSRKMTRGERIVLALNWGNEGNREAIRTQAGREMSDVEVIKAIETLTPEELELVNKLWVYVDKFYPELSAVEQQATGIAPAKVEASEFEINGVRMRGGYYPLQADTALSWKAEMHAVEERAQKLMQGGGAARASTKHGATIERIGFGGQAVNLDIDGLFKHVDGVVHDITHRQAVTDADRLLRNERVRNALSESIGREGVKAVNQAVTRLAAGNTHPSDLAILNKLMRWSRIATSYGAMGYSARTALINVTGLIPAVPEVGTIPLTSALMKEISGVPLPVTNQAKFDEMRSGGASAYAAAIMEKSTMMENRAQTISRDVYETLRNLKGNSAWNNFKAYAFWMIAKVDGFVSRAVWSAAYHNALQDGASEQDAVYHADRTVIRTQGGGLKIDLSAVEDQNEIYRALSPMYTYFNAVLNLSRRQRGRLETGQIKPQEYAAAMAWIFVMVPITEWLMFGDDDEPAAEALARDIPSYYLGQWFGIRELSSYIKYGRFFETPLQRTMGAVPAATGQTFMLLFDEDKEFDKNALRAYTNALPVVGFPSGAQINRTIGYLMEMEESGEDLDPWGLLVTGKHDTD